VVIGNHTHKYTSRNPAIRWLTERFVARLTGMVDQIAQQSSPADVLEVGCGEGVVSVMLDERFPTVVGLDLPDANLRDDWRVRPGPHYVHGDALRLPFADNQFDLLVCVEVLEHLPDPRTGLIEMVRVARRDLLLSVPREPIFRGCNLVTGRYGRELGNTPGHLNHWSTRSFTRFASEFGEVKAVATPFPWTMLWLRLPD
jgi:ubiquinone/menaquinone biosynthesis C-methylase UbiE